MNNRGSGPHRGWHRSKVSLLDAVAERFAPGLSPRAEALFAGIAVPLGTVRTNTAPAQHISLLRELQKLVRRQTPVRDLLHILVAIAPGADGSSASFHISIILLLAKVVKVCCPLCL